MIGADINPSLAVIGPAGIIDVVEIRTTKAIADETMVMVVTVPVIVAVSPGQVGTTGNIPAPIVHASADRRRRDRSTYAASGMIHYRRSCAASIRAANAPGSKTAAVPTTS